jgi:hypothetical protein
MAVFVDRNSFDRSLQAARDANVPMIVNVVGHWISSNDFKLIDESKKGLITAPFAAYFF